MMYIIGDEFFTSNVFLLILVIYEIITDKYDKNVKIQTNIISASALSKDFPKSMVGDY